MVVVRHYRLTFHTVIPACHTVIPACHTVIPAHAGIYGCGLPLPLRRITTLDSGVRRNDEINRRIYPRRPPRRGPRLRERSSRARAGSPRTASMSS